MTDNTHLQPPEDPFQEAQPPRTRLFVAIVLSATTLLGAVLVFAGLWLTGYWNGPSNDDPAESVDRFLTALLTQRNADDAATYTCASQSGDLGKVVDQLDGAQAEARFSWSKVTTLERTDSAAVVTAKVTHELTGDTATWTFALVTGDPDNAWRVCGLQPDSD